VKSQQNSGRKTGAGPRAWLRVARSEKWLPTETPAAAVFTPQGETIVVMMRQTVYQQNNGRVSCAWLRAKASCARISGLNWQAWCFKSLPGRSWLRWQQPNASLRTFSGKATTRSHSNLHPQPHRHSRCRSPRAQCQIAPSPLHA